MMKYLLSKLKPYLLSLLVIASLAVIFIGVSRAADQTITCDETSGCTGSTGPLFEETNMAPLDTITRTVTTQNNYPENRDFAVEIISATFSDSTPSLAQILTVEVIEQESASSVYGPKTIEQWKNDGYVILSNVPTGGNRHYDFTATMANVGNDYQEKELVFDLNLGFEALPPSPTVAGVGGPVGAPICTNAKPGLPTNFTASVGPGAGGVTLSWTTPASPYTYFLIAYSDSFDWPPKWGNPDVGNVTSYTVSGLESGVYWFWLRAGNGCMPGDFVGPISPGVIAGAPGAGPVAPGFLPGVLGTEEEVEGVGGKVLGEEACTDEYYRWWLPLVVQTILTLSYLWFIRKREEKTKRWWLFPFLLAILSQVGHEILSCTCATGEWCPRYWLLNLIILIISLLTCYFFSRRKK